MDDPNNVKPSPLVIFCQGFISRHSADWPPQERVLAEEFTNAFAMKSSMRDGLRELCAQLGITLSFSSLPPELRGFNCVYDNKTEIVISEQQSFPGAEEHTLLHELREVLERIFVGLDYPTADNGQELEKKAEDFARLARMAAINKSLPTFFEGADQIDRKWARVAAFVLIGGGALLYLFSCAMLPHLEDAAER